MKLQRGIFLILALLAADACAQQAAPAPAKTTAFFRTLGLGVNLAGLHYRHANKDVPVSVTEDARSEFCPLPPGTPLEFFRLEKGTDDSVRRVPVATVAVRDGAKLPLFVFSAGPDKRIVVETLDDTLAAFPAGAYRVINRLDQPVEAVFKEQKLPVPARGTAVMKLRDPGTTVFVRMFLAGGPRPRPIFSNNWAFTEVVRTLVVVVPPEPPSTTPLVRRIPEPVSAAIPPETPPTQAVAP